MPKKHNQNFNLSRSNYVHPSLKSAKPNHGEASSAAATRGVNERLNQLRLSQSPKASPEKVDQITAAVTQKSVPPNLRAVLNIPETATPRPKPGVRRRRLPGQPAGPAAPQSWMERSQHAPAYARAQARKRARYSAESLNARLRPSNVSSLPGVEMPARGSLLDQAFKVMAMDWDFVSEYEQMNLPTIPVRLKGILLSYLSAFGPEIGISVGDLRLLFHTDNSEFAGATGTHDFKRLDLTGLIWGDLTLPGLEKYLASADKAKFAVRRKSGGVELQQAEVLDSWDQEAPEISPALSNGRFSALTHLSLAKPDPNSPSLWSSLLSTTGNLPTITHLSLAYWPAPSLTPNSNTASVHARGSPRPIQLSGTGFYSHTLDNDYSEASNILRRLSLNTICLEWLDLEGCGDWWLALIWTAAKDQDQHSVLQIANDHEPSQPSRRTRSIGSSNEWASQISSGPDWNGPWRFVRYIRLSQGWVPCNLNYSAVRASHGILKSLQDYLDRGKDEQSSIEWIEEVITSEIIDWALVDRQAQNIKRTIQKRRTGGNIVEVDRGWIVD